MKMSLIVIYLYLLTIAFATESFASLKGDVKKGNLLYNNKKYDKAIKRYEDALSKRPASGIANFNLGTAFYKKALYNKALDSFNRAIASGDKALIWAADYNIGNSVYRIGNAKEEKDPKGAKGQYESALEFYKRAMELNPKDRDAKFNYEFVEKRLKEISRRQEKPREQEKNQEKAPQKEKGQGQEGVRSEGEEKEKKPKEQEKTDAKGLGSGEEKKKREATKEKKERSQAEEKRSDEEGSREEERKQKQDGLEAYQSPQEESRGEMSEEEAKMLLEGYKGEEVTGKALRLRKKPIAIQEPARDW